MSTLDAILFLLSFVKKGYSVAVYLERPQRLRIDLNYNSATYSASASYAETGIANLPVAFSAAAADLKKIVEDL